MCVCMCACVFVFVLFCIFCLFSPLCQALSYHCSKVGEGGCPASLLNTPLSIMFVVIVLSIVFCRIVWVVICRVIICKTWRYRSSHQGFLSVSGRFMLMFIDVSLLSVFMVYCVHVLSVLGFCVLSYIPAYLSVSFKSKTFYYNNICRKMW